MSDAPFHIWFDLGCWLFGFRFSRHEIGIAFGPLSLSVVPSRIGQRRR